MSRCIVCGSTNLHELHNFNNCPVCIGVVPPRLFGKIKGLPLVIGECKECGHVQQTKNLVNKEMIYKDKYSGLLSSVPMPSKTSVGSTEAQMSFDFFVNSNIPRGKVLDIGCHDGYFLSLIKKKGYKVQGIDPSPATKIARQKYKIRVIQDYFSTKYFKENSFDVIILRNILEHLPKANNFLADINKVLKPGGYVFIEVPNTPFLLKNGVLLTFHHQHLSYFSIDVLRYLLSMHSMKIVRFKKGYFLYILARKVARAKNKAFKSAKKDNKAIKEAKQYFSIHQKRINVLNKILKRDNRIAIFGAGGDTAHLINMLNENLKRKIKYVYDNNRLKHHNYLAELPVEVRSPKNIRHDKAEAVIVSTNLHQAEIVKQLKAMNIAELKIVTLYPRVRFA